MSGNPRGESNPNAISEELAAPIVQAITLAERNRTPVPTAEQLAVQFRKPEGVIKRACSLLEERGLIRASQKVSEHTNPAYFLAPPQRPCDETPDAGGVGLATGSAFSATARVFQAILGTGLRMAGHGVSTEQATTEDFSIFVRITGQLEGSLCVGLDRKFARHVLGRVARRRVNTIDHTGLVVLTSITNRIAATMQADLERSGRSVDITPSSAVYPVGTKITTLGVPQSVAVLKSEHGSVVVHVVLREVPRDDSLAA